MSKEELLKQQIANAILVANSAGGIAIGILECLISIKKGKCKILIVANDVTPKHLIDELIILCKQSSVPVLVGASRKELGEYAQIDCSASAISIENPGHDPCYFRLILKQADVNPKTFHEVMLESRFMFREVSNSELLKIIVASLKFLDSLGDLHSNNGSQNEVAKSLADVIVCSLCLANRLNIDPLQYISPLDIRWM